MRPTRLPCWTRPSKPGSRSWTPPTSTVTALAPAGTAPAQVALRWIIQQPGVTTVIPGARNVTQARQNASAAALPPLTSAQLQGIEDIYDRRIRAQVHHRW